MGAAAGCRRLADVVPAHDLEDAAVRMARAAGGLIGPSDLAALLIGESDLSCRSGAYGLVAPNRFAIRLNPRDLARVSGVRAVVRELERTVESESMERGRRLEGPVRVWFEGSAELLPGESEVHATERKGRRPPWAQLLIGAKAHELTMNQALVGRAGDAEVVIDHPSVSLRHALIWREGREVWVRDLGSSEGTILDGEPVSAATPIAPGGRLAVGAVECRLRVLG